MFSVSTQVTVNGESYNLDNHGTDIHSEATRSLLVREFQKLLEHAHKMERAKDWVDSVNGSDV